MTYLRRAVLFAAVLLAARVGYPQASEGAITKGLQGLRSLSPTDRQAATLKLAQDIRTLPPGKQKLGLADGLCHLATEGDAGAEALQAVAGTLTKALTETPVPAKGDQPAMPYLDLANLVRYEHVTASVDDPQFAKAGQILAANDADVEKADFTLRDLHNKKVTFSELRGKIVMVNFWATWCPPCRKEMPDLDLLYTHFQNQGLVVLSITDEDGFKVSQFLATSGYHPTVLMDPGGKVHKTFHVEGIPRTFLFGRDGKLLAEAIDQRTQRQFLAMLQKTDLHP